MRRRKLCIMRGFMTLNRILLLAVTLFTAQCMLTQRHIDRHVAGRAGRNMSEPSASLNVATNCSEFSLNIPLYNYSGVTMSGYLNIGKGGSALGFILYGRENTPREKLSSYPVLIWLNGGPGSSSQIGNFFELGPFYLKPATFAPYQIVKNKNSWVKNYTVIFVDQPVGTGLSYADPVFPNVYCQSMGDVAKDFFNALKQLYLNPKGCLNMLSIKPTQDLFIFGQSYAGKYVPAIAEKIVREAQDNKGFLTGLRGVGIGDGFTQPLNILQEMGEYAYNLGLLDYQERSAVEKVILNAAYQARSGLWKDLKDSFEKVMDIIVDGTGGVNVYDITQYKDYPDLIIEEYLNSFPIQNLYKLNKDIPYQISSEQVYMNMTVDFMKPYVELVESLLMRNVPVLIYNGQNDLIVETPGTFKWVERLRFKDAEQFRELLFKTWKVNGKVAGYYKAAGFLELRTVNNAGHLVPMDQGEAALEMLNTFVTKALNVTESTA